MDSSEAVKVKARKPYVITKQRERWSEEEHARFLEALRLHGRAWRRIEEYIGTKTAVQIRSHAQKFFTKLEKQKEAGGSWANGGLDSNIEIPPPRPKKKPSRPYPRKDPAGASGSGAATTTATTHNTGAGTGRSRKRSAQYLDWSEDDDTDMGDGDDMGEGCHMLPDEAAAVMGSMAAGPPPLPATAGMSMYGNGTHIGLGQDGGFQVPANMGLGAIGAELREDMSETQGMYGSMPNLPQQMVLHPNSMGLAMPNYFAAAPQLSNYLGMMAGVPPLPFNNSGRAGQVGGQSAAGCHQMGAQDASLAAHQLPQQIGPAKAHMRRAPGGDGANAMQRMNAGAMLQNGYRNAPAGPRAGDGQEEELEDGVSEVTVAAVAAAASAAAAAAAAAVVAAAGQHVQAHLQANPPKGFPFFGLPPTTLAHLSRPGSHVDQMATGGGGMHSSPQAPQAAPAQQSLAGGLPLQTQQQLLSMLLGFAQQQNQAGPAAREPMLGARQRAHASSRPTGGGASYDDVMAPNLEPMQLTDSHQPLMPDLQGPSQVPLLTLAAGPNGPVLLLASQAALGVYGSQGQQFPPVAAGAGMLQPGHNAMRGAPAGPAARTDQHSSDGVSACSRETHDVDAIRHGAAGAAAHTGRPPVNAANHHRNVMQQHRAVLDESEVHVPHATGSSNPTPAAPLQTGRQQKAVSSAAPAPVGVAAGHAVDVPVEEASVAVLRPQPRRFGAPMPQGHAHGIPGGPLQQPITRHASSVWSTPVGCNLPGSNLAGQSTLAAHVRNWAGMEESAAQQHDGTVHKIGAGQVGAGQAAGEHVGVDGDDEPGPEYVGPTEEGCDSSDDDGDVRRGHTPPNRAQQAWMMQAGRGRSPCTSDNVGALVEEAGGARHAHAAHLSNGGHDSPEVCADGDEGDNRYTTREGQGTSPAMDDGMLTTAAHVNMNGHGNQGGSGDSGSQGTYSTRKEAPSKAQAGAGQGLRPLQQCGKGGRDAVRQQANADVQRDTLSPLRNGNEAQGSNMLQANGNGSSQDPLPGNGSNENGNSNGDHSQHLPNHELSGNGSGGSGGAPLGTHASSGNGSGQEHADPARTNGSDGARTNGSDGAGGSNEPNTSGGPAKPKHGIASDDPNTLGSDGTNGTNGSDGNNGSNGKGSNTICYGSSGNLASRGGSKTHPRTGGSREAPAGAHPSTHASSHHHHGHHSHNPNNASSRHAHARAGDTVPRSSHGMAPDNSKRMAAGDDLQHVQTPDWADAHAAEPSNTNAQHSGGQRSGEDNINSGMQNGAPQHGNALPSLGAGPLRAEAAAGLRIAPLLGVAGSNAAALAPQAYSLPIAQLGKYAPQALSPSTAAVPLAGPGAMQLAGVDASQLQMLLANLAGPATSTAAYHTLPIQQLARLGLVALSATPPAAQQLAVQPVKYQAGRADLSMAPGLGLQVPGSMAELLQQQQQQLQQVYIEGYSGMPVNEGHELAGQHLQSAAELSLGGGRAFTSLAAGTSSKGAGSGSRGSGGTKRRHSDEPMCPEHEAVEGLKHLRGPLAS